MLSVRIRLPLEEAARRSNRDNSILRLGTEKVAEIFSPPFLIFIAKFLANESLFIHSVNESRSQLAFEKQRFSQGTTHQRLSARPKQYVREEKEALKEMAKIHPDKELIVGDGVEREMLYSGQAKEGTWGNNFCKTLIPRHITYRTQ